MATVVAQSVPPLVAGDKLTRAEFLRRWEAQPEIKNAELLGGMVYMSSTVSVEHGVKNAELLGGMVYMSSPVSVEHGDMEGQVGGWLQVYSASTPGTASGHNTTSFILDDVPQPDLNLRILPEYGGRSWVANQYLHGIPDLLAEICASSATYDLHVKLDLYQGAGVPEYLAILLYEKEIRWHVLVDGQYQLLPGDPNGLWHSRIFPGLWLDGQALWEGKMSQVLARLQEGLQAPEHQTLVADLARRRARGEGKSKK